jgi:hypothetical protein
VNARSKNGVVLCLLCSLEVHLAGWALLPKAQRVPCAPPANVEAQIAVEAEAPPIPTAFEPAPGASRGSAPAEVRYVVVRPEVTLPKERSSPAAAGSVEAAPSGEIPVAVAQRASNYAGGVTTPVHGGESFADDDSAFGSPDLSTPAHLQGRVNWECQVRGAPLVAQVHVRVLVGADGTAERVEAFDRGEAREAILEAALPCALRQRYVSGTDGTGRAVKRWSRPFRVVVTGLL